MKLDLITIFIALCITWTKAASHPLNSAYLELTTTLVSTRDCIFQTLSLLLDGSIQIICATSDAVNTMISDATGLFPRLCVSLSDIVFQKTKGNPYFLIEFLHSLVDQSLLFYSVRQRRWVWDEAAIKGMDITDNVLFLLVNKIRSELTQDTIDILKVVSCFGIRIHESVVTLLSATTRYSHIQDRLENLGRESFMVKVARDRTSSSNIDEWKFAHDKVRGKRASSFLLSHLPISHLISLLNF